MDKDEETCGNCLFWNLIEPEQMYDNDPEWYQDNFHSCMNPEINSLDADLGAYPTRSDIISY